MNLRIGNYTPLCIYFYFGKHLPQDFGKVLSVSLPCLGQVVYNKLAFSKVPHKNENGGIIGH